MKTTLLSMMEGHGGSLAAGSIFFEGASVSSISVSATAALWPNTCAHMRMDLLGGSIALPLLVTRSNEAEANRARSLGLVGLWLDDVAGSPLTTDVGYVSSGYMIRLSRLFLSRLIKIQGHAARYSRLPPSKWT